MDQSWWGSVIQWIVWWVVMAFVMGWVAKSRFRARQHSDIQCLVHPPSTLIIGIMCFVFFTGIAILSNVFSNDTVTWWTTAIFAGFALLSVPMIADYFLARHRISDEGMNYGRLSGPRRSLRWSDLRCIQYAPVMKWFRLETHSGQVARVSAMLVGLPEFARLLLAHAPSHAIDAETRSVLEATARGYPPPL